MGREGDTHIQQSMLPGKLKIREHGVGEWFVHWVPE